MKMSKMSWIMVSCCAVMVAGFFLLPRMGIRLGPALSTLLILTCPLSHFAMMAFMGKGHDHGERGRATYNATERPALKLITYTRKLLLPAPHDKT